MKRLFTDETKKSASVLAVTAAAGVLLYELLEHFSAVREAVSSCLKVTAPIFYGLCLAFVLNLPMCFFENKLFGRLKAKKPRAARALSIALSYLILIGVIALIVSLIVPKVVSSAYNLVNSLGEHIALLTERLEAWTAGLRLGPEAYAVLESVSERIMQKLNDSAVGMVPELPRMTVNAVSVVYGVIVTLVISIHGLIKKERLLGFLRRIALAIVPKRHSEAFFRICTYANRTFRRYISGQSISCLILGGLCYIGMRIIGVPYPELIAVFLALAAFIPIIGPWISTTASALMILVSRPEDPWLALWFVILVLSVQLLDDNLIAPRVVGDAVGVPGMLVLIAIVVAAGLFGVFGLIVAVPTAAVIYRFFGEWVERRARMRNEEL